MVEKGLGEVKNIYEDLKGVEDYDYLHPERHGHKISKFY